MKSTRKVRHRADAIASATRYGRGNFRSTFRNSRCKPAPADAAARRPYRKKGSRAPNGMPNIGTVILAAGESSRLGQPKQLVQFRGKSLVRRIVDAATEAGCEPILIVTGSDAAAETSMRPPHLNPLPLKRGEERTTSRALVDLIGRELKQTSATLVENENWRGGIGSSIRRGVQSLIDNASNLEAIVVLVCDQPFVDARTIKGLIALREKTNKPLVASAYSGTLGVPALFDRSCFPELIELSDESGAKSIIMRNRERVAEFPFPQGEIDIDTVADYEKHK
jgi:molybdenum cofactor cytidylyltransferase